MAAPTRTLSAGNLPAELTTFVGRRNELSAIRRQLSVCRLVTLTGFGGVGKTRLALHAAAAVRRAYPDGVWLIDLSALQDPALLADSAATALGLCGPWAGSARGALVEYLDQRSALLVLDNCEHLIDACAEFAGEMLRTCPNLRLLTTSRQALGIAGERILPVDPLPVPDDETTMSAALSVIESVALFFDRATAVLPEFVLTDDVRSDVAAICRQLEGIPLALELAAVRLRSLSVRQIRERLADRFALLTAGSRGSPDRQRTLRGSIEWSYDLCTPAERELWSRASVFVGGFELDAAAAVCASEEDGELLDTLLALVDKSILLREEHDGQVRYRMLEVVRQHGERELRESGEWPQLQSRHRDFYVALVRQADEEWITDNQPGWMKRLRRERANVRSTLAFCLDEPGSTVSGLRTAAALQEHWLAQGQVDEGRHWVDLFLEKVTEPTLDRLRGLCSSVWLAPIQGEIDVAAGRLKEARELAVQLGPRADLLVKLVAGLHMMMHAGDLIEAIRLLEKALEGFREVGDRHHEVQTLVALGLTYGFAGEAEKALGCHRECVTLTESVGESWFRSFSMWNAGLLANQRGDTREAIALVRESLALKGEIDDRFGIAMCLEALAWMTTPGDARRSATLLGAAVAAHASIGLPMDVLPGFEAQRRSCEARLLGELGDATFRQCLDRGRTLDRGAAIDYGVDRRSA